MDAFGKVGLALAVALMAKTRPAESKKVFMVKLRTWGPIVEWERHGLSAALNREDYVTQTSH
jgi:hypothetical protein